MRGALYLVVDRVGVEPTRYCYRRILSPLRLPIPPPVRGVLNSTQTQVLVKRRT